MRHSGHGDSELDTIYLGGGTPSKLGESGIRDLLASIRAAGLRSGPASEVTIEANPEDVSLAAVGAWVRAGVNRLSIGIQSFSPPALGWMHRTHDADQAAAAVAAARAGGMENVSVDLIYALPDTVSRRWSDDLDRVLGLEPEHVSVYGLTIEPQTPLGRWTARGEVAPQTEDRAAEEFHVAHERLTAAGYEHYEVSNYARPGRRSRHNSAYWRRVPYLGIGPSAHSFDGAARRWNVAAYAGWEAALARGDDPVAGVEQLTADERAAEETYLGLRTDAGLALTSARDVATARTWVTAGWAVLTGDHVRLTPEGWLRLDALVGSLTPLSH